MLRDGVLPRFGDYELVSEIARGGMGVVYRARQTSLNRIVAVKLILTGQLATPESVQRFRLEAEAAARLHHPGIVPIYEIGQYETQYFYSMKLIDGVSLAECREEFLYHRSNSSNLRRIQQVCIAELIEKIAKALDFAHKHGVLHRDLKPSNILIDEHGQPHLTDFGLAKLTGPGEASLTLTQAVLGTPGYLAPEQAAGSADIATTADVYGLGATLYELLTGKPPFVGATAIETMWKAIHENPIAPRKVDATIDRDLETVVMRCLEKLPENRYPSALSVAEDLTRFILRKPIHARPVSSTEHAWRWCQRNPRMAIMAVTLLSTFLIGSGVATWQWWRAEHANVSLTSTNADLKWSAIDNMVDTGQSSRALANVAAMMRSDLNNWKAAMFGISLIEQRRFPIPLAPAIRHPDGNPLTIARLSSDGNRVVTASWDGTARVWDAATSLQILPEFQHKDVVTWAEFSPDGQRILTASKDKTVRMWNAIDGDSMSDPIAHDAEVVKAHFSSDGKYFLTRTEHDVSVFDRNGQSQMPSIHFPGRVVEAKFISDDSQLFIAHRSDEKSSVQVWDVTSGRQQWQLPTEKMNGADINRDGTRVVTAGGYLEFWDVVTKEKKHQVLGRSGQWETVVFSMDGQSIAATNFDQFAQVWHVESGRPMTPELPHYYLINGAAFLGSSDQLMTWGEDSLVKIWNTRSGDLLTEPMRHSDRVQCSESGMNNGQVVFLTTVSHFKSRPSEIRTSAAQLWRIAEAKKPKTLTTNIDLLGLDAHALTSDGRWIAYGNTEGVICVLETSSGKPVCPPLSIHGGAWGLFFDPTDRRLIATTSSGQVSIWSLPEGTLVSEPIELKTMIQPLERSRDGHRFASGSMDGKLRLWNSTGQVIREYEHGSKITSVAFSADGKYVASAGSDRMVRIWDSESVQMHSQLSGHTSDVMRVLFSPDGNRIVTTSVDTTARIWDVSGRQLLVLPHQGDVIDADISPDGTLVATASRDRTAALWNMTTGRQVVQSLFHQHGVRNVRFSPNGQALLTLDFRGPRLWDVATGHPLTIQMPHRIGVGIAFQSTPIGPLFTPDARSVVISTSTEAPTIWEFRIPPKGIPRWFPEFLEAIAGHRLAEGSEAPIDVGGDTFLKLESTILASKDDDFYTTWAQQWLQRK